MRLAIIAAAVFASSTTFAIPHPDNPYRGGANHHLGDDSFVAKHRRAPSQRTDTEVERMRVHLEYVRAWLAGRPATRPELADRRAELLGYLDDYISKGTTPRNVVLPWRTPVFIDENGAICAVGYLIERSVGRALPERIANLHRYDVLETIALEMPEVAAWIEGSGFTLEELASIQPAYSEAEAEAWQPWEVAKLQPADGELVEIEEWREATIRGVFKRRQMEGVWTVRVKGVVVGKGTFKRGRGTWQSFHPDGKTVLARGPYVANRAHGAWKFFHASGNLAAEGSFVAGTRAGRWRFYQDTKDRTPIAIGRFSSKGLVSGVWTHFDGNGALLAKTWIETPSHWRAIDPGTIDGGAGHVLDITPGADGVHRVIHQGQVQLERNDIQSNTHRLELLERGGEQLYLYASGFAGEAVMYDANGFRLERDNGGWTAANCRWGGTRKAMARRGDIARLHNQLYVESRREHVEVTFDGSYSTARIVEPGERARRCGVPRKVSARRAAKLDKLLASRSNVRTPTAKFIRQLILEERNLDENALDPTDQTRYLAAHMLAYLEWPHIDGRFVKAFETMPGRRRCYWAAPCHDTAGGQREH